MKKENSSYNQILKSTTIFGGSQVLVILIGLIRTKIIAVLLGPMGVGIIGIYQSVIEMVRSTCSLGIDTAGVKDIAEADNNTDKDSLYKTITRFNKWFRASALLALLICIAFCYPISHWAFGSDDYAIYIACLSVAAALHILATGKSTILQGLRKIPEMAKSAVWGSLIGLIVTIPVYYIWRLDGIVPALIINALIWFLCVMFYYRKQTIKGIDISNKEAFEAGLSSLRLGVYIVLAGIVSTVSMFLVRAYISRNIDLDAAGLFQSAWVITNVYLGLILKSMGSDYFPRLSAISGEKEKVKKLVNEQSYIVLVIALPIIVGMLLFADFALSVLYSYDFTGAGTILRWQVLGTFLKVLCWPISFILLARNKGLVFLITEIIFYVAYLLSAYLLYPAYGLDAAGIGYLIAYAVYFPVIVWAGYSISEFKWNGDILKMTLVSLVFICAAFYIAHFHTGHTLTLSIAILCLSLLYAYIKLKKVFSLEDLKNWFRKK